MDVREKLVELLDIIIQPGEKTLGDIADHLIANGVTVQEWVKVEDRLPRYNETVLVYRPSMAEKILVDNYYGFYGEDDDEWFEGWACYGKNSTGNDVITHWMPLPHPPK